MFLLMQAFNSFVINSFNLFNSENIEIQSITIIINKNHKMQKQLKKVAVVLSGCGKNDGSEITEAVSMMINLSKAKI